MDDKLKICISDKMACENNHRQLSSHTILLDERIGSFFWFKKTMHKCTGPEWFLILIMMNCYVCKESEEEECPSD